MCRVQQVPTVDVPRMKSKSFSRNRNSESRVQQFSEPAGMGASNLRREYSPFVRSEPKSPLYPPRLIDVGLGRRATRSLSRSLSRIPVTTGPLFCWFCPLDFHWNMSFVDGFLNRQTDWTRNLNRRVFRLLCLPHEMIDAD